MLDVVAPATEWPITLDEAKAHLRVEHTDDDVLIESLIVTAAGMIEPPHGQCDFGLCEQTLRYSVRRWPCYGQGIRLIGVATSIVSVTYFDDDNASQTVDAADYFLSRNGRFVCFVEDFDAEPLYVRADAVSVTYKVGKADPAKIPPALRLAVKFLVARLYASRGEMIDATLADDPLLPRILAPYRRIPA